ncbi:hypothetical protein HGA91_01595 [candidate division WWE3 bacterium]|nr:hypothetical protein [candidate division WWE3 bacterium]
MDDQIKPTPQPNSTAHQPPPSNNIAFRPLAGAINTNNQSNLNKSTTPESSATPDSPNFVKGHTVIPSSSPQIVTPDQSIPQKQIPTTPEASQVRTANPLFMSNEPTIPYQQSQPTISQAGPGQPQPVPTQPIAQQAPIAQPPQPAPIIDPTILQKKAVESQQLMNAAAQIEQKLVEKQELLTNLQKENQPHKDQLQTLNTESKTIGAVIQNLRQQFNNLDGNSLHVETMDEIQEKIKEKEQQSIQLESKINALHQSISQEQQLTNEVENYRQQIRELVQQQQKLQDVINEEEQKLNQITQQLNQQVQETQSRANQIKQLEEFLNEAILNTAHTPPTPETVKTAQFMNPNEIPVLTQKPNAVNGVVKDQNGRLLPDMVVMIKDAANHNLRAMKSNKLGQFVVTTPLVNGQYYIEVSKPGFTFAVVEVKLDGGILPPIEVIGHETTT